MYARDKVWTQDTFVYLCHSLLLFVFERIFLIHRSVCVGLLFDRHAACVQASGVLAACLERGGGPHI